MSQAFQYSFNIYEDCDPGRGYRFTIFDRSLPAEWKGTACETAAAIDFPLSMNFEGRPDLSEFARRGEPHRIGVFIRLSPERPMRGLFQALKRLREHTDAQLWWYGRGVPSLYASELDELAIRDAVFFRGESVNIERTLREDGLSLVWTTSYGATIGYSTLEVLSFGFPTICWNLSDSNPAGELPSYREPQRLAAETLHLLRNPQDRVACGRRSREWAAAAYSIHQYSAALQDLMRSMA